MVFAQPVVVSWKRPPELLTRTPKCGEEQGITVLGTTVGRPEFSELQKVIASHTPILAQNRRGERPSVRVVVARATFYIRTVYPDLTPTSMEHDEQIWRCFSTLLGVNPDAPDAHAKASTSLPLVMGSLGLRDASRLRDAAHWGVGLTR